MVHFVLREFLRPVGREFDVWQLWPAHLRARRADLILWSARRTHVGADCGVVVMLTTQHLSSINRIPGLSKSRSATGWPIDLSYSASGVGHFPYSWSGTCEPGVYRRSVSGMRRVRSLAAFSASRTRSVGWPR
jgi:hypothetical protein